MEEFRIDPNIAYDVVELPSRGIHYTNNKFTSQPFFAFKKYTYYLVGCAHNKFYSQ